MRTITYCFGDTLADPGNDLHANSVYNAGSDAAMRGRPMSACPLPLWSKRRPFWIAGWRVTRMTVMAQACGELASASDVKDAIESARTVIHRKAVGPLIKTLA